MKRLTQKEIKAYLKANLSKDLFKRLRPVITSNTYYQKDGSYIGLHLPAFIGVDVDEKFEITTNGVTFTFRNKKVSVSVWIDESVPASITIY